MIKHFPNRRKAWALALMPAAVLPVSVMAQDNKDAAVEEVVVTGSLIRGTPEDAALPVEIVTAQELEEQGDPSPLEFVKNMAASGPTTGEAYYFSGSQLTNNVGFNLRGLGADKTLTLFNGTRAFENTTVYPQIAMERVEVLKDGAAVTYGADATGGVVNLITKDDFDGFEVTSSYKTYDGSDKGEWEIGALAGFNLDNGNILIAAEWDHRSELDSQERDFSSLPFGVNPAPWSPLTNVASWLPRGPLPPGPPTIIPGNTNGAGEWGQPSAAIINDFTKASCEAVGGIFQPGAANNNSCAYGYISYYNLVEENDVYRVMAQLNASLSENVDFRMRMLYSEVDSPHQYGSPSQPVIRGPAIATGATFQLYVPATNPFVADLRRDSGFAGAAAGFTPVTYRAFAHGGNDAFGSGDNHSTPNSNNIKYYHVTAAFTGAITETINYDIGATYNQAVSTNTAPDVMGFRLQEALNGYGGPNCNTQGVDQDPTRFGTQAVAPGGVDTGVRPAGCQWWNPFASSFAAQPNLGLTNPNYRPGAENPLDLVRWAFNERKTEQNDYNFGFNAVFSGETPIPLPGGNVAWGAGAQYRTIKSRETVEDPFYNGETECDWPGQNPASTQDPAFTGCTLDQAGPFLFFANNFPDATEQRQTSYFAEINLPILESLNFSVAGRYEEFQPIDLDTTVYKVSAKWQVIDQFAFRGSYGTNYQAPGTDVIPGDLFNGVNSYTRAGGTWLGAQTYTQEDIEPETATAWNVGAILQLQFGADQDLQIILDYFDIETEDELGLVATANDIADSVFNIPGATATALRLADCSHPLISRVTFNSPCVQGVTNAGNFSSIRTDFGNGPGQHTAGFDLQLNYGIGIGPGTLTFGINATKVVKDEDTAVVLDGFTVKAPDDRLGDLNFATVGVASSELRGNASLNYNFGEHNIRTQFNYISGVDDERYLNPDGSLNPTATGLTPAGQQPGTTALFAPSLYGVFGEDWKSVDLYYLWRASWATVGFSVINVADEDPPASRQEFGYDPRIGSPLGRQFEITLRKEF
jgi:iron complex outermembrane recepter protein